MILIIQITVKNAEKGFTHRMGSALVARMKTVQSVMNSIAISVKKDSF